MCYLLSLGLNMAVVTSCENCNQGKSNQESFEFLLENYRNKLISQEKYLKQKEYIEKLFAPNIKTGTTL